MPDPTRAETDEALERGEIADSAEQAHIALDIGFEIIAERLRRMKLLVIGP